MSRRDAERLAHLFNGNHCAPNFRYTAERSLTGESEWAVVTWQNGKPIERQYSA
jgi:hypothetical protein